MYDHDPVDTNADPDLRERQRRLRELGIGEQPDREFDAVAAELAADAGTPYAMVNFIGPTRQYFAGLYPASGEVTEAVSSVLDAEKVGRTMPLDQGYCPHVVERRTALPLDDVMSYPRFAGNPVVDALDVRSYLGAPLIDDDGLVLGTVCVVAKEPQSWNRDDVARVKATAAKLVDMIKNRRARQQYPQP